MSKALIIGMVLVVTIVAIFLLRSPEDSWVCQNGEWVKHGNPSSSQPTEPCGNQNVSDQNNDNENKSDYSNQGLSEFPMEILDNTQITELDLSNNNLTGALPAEIRHLQNLKILRVNNNSLTGIPAEIGQLENLEILDFGQNQIDTYPNELENLKYNLRVLDLAENNFTHETLNEIKNKLPETQVIE